MFGNSLQSQHSYENKGIKYIRILYGSRPLTGCDEIITKKSKEHRTPVLDVWIAVLRPERATKAKPMEA